jgi:hypothetical protein
VGGFLAGGELDEDFRAVAVELAREDELAAGGNGEFFCGARVGAELLQLGGRGDAEAVASVEFKDARERGDPGPAGGQGGNAVAARRGEKVEKGLIGGNCSEMGRLQAGEGAK